MSVFDVFVPRRDYLVCVDSDGCVMDTMNGKHALCFGPCMVKEWGLEEWEQPILERWNEINLFSMTRGINRFKGLAMALGEIHSRYVSIEGIETLQDWSANTPALSNRALAKAVGEENRPEARRILEKALAWSESVNVAIAKLPEERKRPYEGAKEGLAAAHSFADVAVVSSANREAVEEEWGRFGLLEHADILLTQEVGSKRACIAGMMKFGYGPRRVLMVGDAPGDWEAAEKNGVFFFPILVDREQESWAELGQTGLEKLRDLSYGGAYQERKKREFYANLGG